MMKEKTLHELAKEYPDKTYNELTVIKEDLKLKAEGGACITSGIKRDRDATELQQRKKTKIEELEEALANALEVNESHQRYNGKLQTRMTELEEDNKKLAHQVEDLKMNHVRKAGL